MKRHLTIFILCVGLFSCSLNSGNSEDIGTVHFRQFLKKFKLLQFPLDFSLGMEANNLPTINIKSTDSLFIKEYGDGATCYGMLPDTNNYYGLIFLIPVENAFPEIITYDKTGRIISKEGLVINSCGGGPIIYCSSTGTIKENLTIHCVDTIKQTAYDSTGTPIDGTLEYYCKYKEGKINSDGKITMTGEQTKDLK